MCFEVLNSKIFFLFIYIFVKLFNWMLLYFNSPGGIFEYPSGDLGPGKLVLVDEMDICDKLRFIEDDNNMGF